MFQVCIMGKCMLLREKDVHICAQLSHYNLICRIQTTLLVICNSSHYTICVGKWLLLLLKLCISRCSSCHKYTQLPTFQTCEDVVKRLLISAYLYYGTLGTISYICLFQTSESCVYISTQSAWHMYENRRTQISIIYYQELDY